MDAQTFLDNFSTVADAPGGVAQLRGLVLDLAVTGRLVEQKPTEQPASTVLRRLGEQLDAAVSELSLRSRRAARASEPPEPPHIVPAGWAEVRLGDAFLVVMGNSPSGDSYNNQGDGVPLINGPVEFTSAPLGRTVVTQYTTAPSRLCREGDLLVCVRGATTGRTNIAGFDACIGRGVALVRAWEAQPFINLVMWNLGSQLLAAGKGTTFPSVSQDDLLRLSVLIPPLDEQERIVAKVDDLMALCDELESGRDRCRRATMSFRSSSLNALTEARTPEDLGDAWERVSAKWPNLANDAQSVREIRETILKLAVKGHLAVVDEEPKSVPFGDIASLQNGYAFKSEWYTEEGISLVRCQNIGHGDLRWDDKRSITPERAADFARFDLRLGDVVLALDRPIISTGLKVARVQETDLPCVLLQRVARVSPDPDVLDDDYLWLWLHSPDFVGSIDPGRSNGVPHISTREVASIEVSLPSLRSQRDTVRTTEQLLALCDTLERALGGASTAATSLASSASTHLRRAN